MEQTVLNNPAVYPTEEILASHLGHSDTVFKALFESTRSVHPDFLETWKYYNDGKRWLLNVSRKKKTLFWLSVGQGFFRTPIYFNAKAEHAVLNSRLPETLKAEYRKSAGRTFRGITIVIEDITDIEAFRYLPNVQLRVR